ncbi:hypothetical protein [Teredinibacter purpureus]|uniref:hypothetical protein n=1 Tax=Teredinibacter purpureus TaxID=2731756 RepID=UPI001F18C913|nr:hypothetical protein [Teredinibacter purpureus]
MSSIPDNTQLHHPSFTPKDPVLTINDDKVIAVGQQRVHVSAVTTKICEDIAFLEDRIHRLEEMKAPSETVINTYRAMLESRQSVLEWLQEHPLETSQTTEPKIG